MEGGQEQIPADNNEGEAQIVQQPQIERRTTRNQQRKLDEEAVKTEPALGLQAGAKELAGDIYLIPQSKA